MKRHWAVQCSKLAVVRWPAASDFFVWPGEISKPQVRLACGIFFIKKLMIADLSLSNRTTAFSHDQVYGKLPNLILLISCNNFSLWCLKIFDQSYAVDRDNIYFSGFDENFAVQHSFSTTM
jgi:hypothetical protein